MDSVALDYLPTELSDKQNNQCVDSVALDDVDSVAPDYFAATLSIEQHIVTMYKSHCHVSERATC